MLEYECPRCHKRAIPLWPQLHSSRKTGSWLSDTATTCLTCGTEVTATFSSVLRCTIPFVAAMALAWIFIDSTPIFWMVVAVFLLASLWVNNKFVVWIEKVNQ